RLERAPLERLPLPPCPGGSVAMGIDESVRDTSAGEELAIRRTLACYCHYIDDGRFADLADLFAPDGSFVLGTISATGRGELLRLFEERQGQPQQRGRHLT